MSETIWLSSVQEQRLIDAIKEILPRNLELRNKPIRWVDLRQRFPDLPDRPDATLRHYITLMGELGFFGVFSDDGIAFTFTGSPDWMLRENTLRVQRFKLPFLLDRVLDEVMERPDELSRAP
ncbi:MAG: hypothetical protein IJC43_05025 [Clostridia bacterium]|nr:hypothetical protein [Clostridia bacterium]